MDSEKLDWFSDAAWMAASPTLRPIPGGRQVPEDGDGGGGIAWKGKDGLVAKSYFMDTPGIVGIC